MESNHQCSLSRNRGHDARPATVFAALVLALFASPVAAQTNCATPDCDADGTTANSLELHYQPTGCGGVICKLDSVPVGMTFRIVGKGPEQTDKCGWGANNGKCLHAELCDKELYAPGCVPVGSSPRCRECVGTSVRYFEFMGKCTDWEGVRCGDFYKVTWSDEYATDRWCATAEPAEICEQFE